MSHLLLSLPILLLFSLLTPPAAAAPSTISRRSHSGSLINDTIYFIGGLGTIVNDNNPLKSISALDLNKLVFNETSVSFSIYNHAATSNRSWTTYQIGISFGQSSSSTPEDGMQWLDPNTGEITMDVNNVNGPGTASPGPLVGRVGHTLVRLGRKLYAFGGYTMAKTPVKAANIYPVVDTPVYDIPTNTWANRTNGLQRYGHASARSVGDKIVSCFGASTTTSALEAECVYFSVTKGTYTSATLEWTNPDDKFSGQRVGHTLVTDTLDSAMLYMFGGMNPDATQFYKDLYRLDTSRLPNIKITKITAAASDIVPGSRSEHAAVVVGENSLFMVVQGGITSSTNNTVPRMMASSIPYYFSLDSQTWIGDQEFMTLYADQKIVRKDNSLGVGIILVIILACVSVLAAGVAYYIVKGLRDDEEERRRKAEEADGYRKSRASSTMDDRKERKGNSVYPLGGGHNDDQSMAMEPFKSTTSLLQSDESGKKLNKKKSQNQVVDTKPWMSSEPYSPGATTLTENESILGYPSSASPSKHKKDLSQSPSQHTTSNHHGAPGAALAAPATEEAARESYYKDLYVDEHEDDDSSITVSLASESTMSPWAGPRRRSLDLAPPNPRFSRGVISQAHRQLVEAISSPPGAGNRSSGGWDSNSPGGSWCSDDHRRSVNSIQWVSFDPLDLATRPESGFFDPLSQPRSLTVRNASMYSNNRLSQMGGGSLGYSFHNGGNPRMSMFGGSNTSETTEDSGGSYSSAGGRRISAALAARQQRRSLRYSQDSQASLSGRTNPFDVPLSLTSTVEEIGREEEESETISTKVLPVVATKISKPTVAKVINNQRGSRMAVPGVAGPLDEDKTSTSGGGGLGFDIAKFNVNDYGSKTSAATRSSFYHSAANQTRRQSSTLNPSHNRSTNPTRPSENQGQANGTNVLLKMPPPPRNLGDPNEAEDDSVESQRLRTSIMKLGEEMPGFLNYGENM